LIYFRNFGTVGIATFTAIFLVPGWILLRRIPFKQLCEPEWAPVTGLILIVVLYTIDNLLNGLVNPIFTVVAGALSAACAADPSGELSRKTVASRSERRSFGVRRQMWPPIAADCAE
jgi:O-antigen ligase